MARKKGTTSMSDNNDLAAELGLDDAGAGTVTTSNAETSAAPADKVARTAVKIGEIKRQKLSVIPTITRSGGDAPSKYNFGSLEAPSADGFDSDFVAYDPSESEERFSRSVQAAYTKETAQAKAKGLPNKYIGRRSVDADGKLAGIYVIRVDGHDVAGDVPEGDSENEAAATE